MLCVCIKCGKVLSLEWSFNNQFIYDLNYRNEHIWPPIRKWLHIFEAFHLASLQFITFNHFLSLHLFLRSMLEIFYISFLWVSLWLFGHHTFQYKSLSLFPSQKLVCARAFAAHYLSLLWDLHLLSSISKNIKSVGGCIGTSLCMYQNHQDYWPIIYNKLEDRFTTITHRCQDFFHKDRYAYKTS